MKTFICFYKGIISSHSSLLPVISKDFINENKSKAWETYAANKRTEGFSSYTIKAYGIQAKLLVLYFKDAEIATLNTENFREYLNLSGAALKPSSMAHRIRFMKSLFRWCHEEGHIPYNPAVKIKEPKVGKRIPKFLTEREIELLREACVSPMEKALFEFMFSTGCRIGEIVSLERNCINLSNRSAIVRGKGDKEREVYFNIRAEIWLKRYIDHRQDTDPAIFVTERMPHRMSIAQMRYVIKTILCSCGHR